MKAIKWVVLFSWIVAGSAQAALNCTVGQSYTTSVGAVFTCVKHGEFGEVWRAPNGVVWSQNLGQWSNSGVESGSSDATQVCSKIGGTLPGFDDYQHMIFSYFEIEKGTGLITGKGLEDLLYFFPDMWLEGFWTTDLYPSKPNLAVVEGQFIQKNGKLYSGEYHDTKGKYSVRCRDFAN